MSELRWDPLRSRWSIIAPHRGLCRADFLAGDDAPPPCPLCPGQEQHTPPEILAIRPSGGKANGPGWNLRVIPSPRPLLSVENRLSSRPHGLYESLDGVGAHEIIIDTPDHDADLADLTTEHLALWLQTIRGRLNDLFGDSRLRHFCVVRNAGALAGSRLLHPHTQIIALPVPPPELQNKLNASRDYFRRHERCLLCDLLDQERREGERIILDDGSFCAYVPYAAAHPFEIWIAPRRHSHDFTRHSDEQLQQLAQLLRRTLRRLRSALEQPPYQLVLTTAPPPHRRPGRPDCWHSLAADFHWHLTLRPLLRAPGAMTLQLGAPVSNLTPEDAARVLRDRDDDLIGKD